MRSETCRFQYIFAHGNAELQLLFSIISSSLVLSVASKKKCHIRPIYIKTAFVIGDKMKRGLFDLVLKGGKIHGRCRTVNFGSWSCEFGGGKG